MNEVDTFAIMNTHILHDSRRATSSRRGRGSRRTAKWRCGLRIPAPRTILRRISCWRTSASRRTTTSPVKSRSSPPFTAKTRRRSPSGSVRHIALRRPQCAASLPDHVPHLSVWASRLVRSSTWAEAMTQRISMTRGALSCKQTPREDLQRGRVARMLAVHARVPDHEAGQINLWGLVIGSRQWRTCLRGRRAPDARNTRHSARNN